MLIQSFSGDFFVETDGVEPFCGTSHKSPIGSAVPSNFGAVTLKAAFPNRKLTPTKWES